MLGPLFRYLSGARMRHVPYQGGRPDIDVVGGPVPVWFVGVARALPLISSNKLRPIATTGDKRPKVRRRNLQVT